VSPALFDVNFLVALAWPNHSMHALAVRYFRETRDHLFATCPITEAGFVRISLNPQIVAETKSCAAALEILQRFRALPGHRFWPDDLDLAAALSLFPLLSGHRQVTDAYLLALADSKGGRLVTFDRAILTMAPPELEKSVILVS
jgi:toxin-antitoxin system PIN domain toxin